MDADQRFQILSGRVYPKAMVKAAAGVTEPQLNNFVHRSPLRLYSPEPGVGRAREFALIDIYQIALLARLSWLTGSVARSAEALNRLPFDKPRNMALGLLGLNGVGDATIAAALVADLRHLHVGYTWRQNLDPYLLITSESSTSRLIGQRPDYMQLHIIKPDSGREFWGEEAGLFLNMTLVLHDVDNSLWHEIERRVDSLRSTSTDQENGSP